LTLTLFFRVTLPFLAGYFVSYLYRSINAVIGPDLAREFGLTAGELGLLTGMYFFSFGLFQLPLGVLLDRYGPRRVNASLLMAAAAGGLWFALAESGTGLLLARALIGLGVSGCLMSALSAFALWHPAERLSTMNGVAFASGMLGAIAVSVPLEILLRGTGWREVFYGIVVLTVLVSLLLAVAVPEYPRARRAASLTEQLREYAALARDPAFWRIALCIGTTQLAAVALVTLWVATWLRDVGGYSQAEVARALLAFNAAMIAGYLGFGRVADRMVQHGRSTLRLLAGGLAAASACLGLLLLGVRTGQLALWCGFFCCSTAAVLSYSLFSRRYPKEMAGRVNSAVNVSVFIGIFSGQWMVGLILNLWPPTAIGYAPEAYRWAFGVPWLLQFAGLAWLWRGRQLFQR
jgi:predicted MFS family arabinose efflux permease